MTRPGGSRFLLLLSLCAALAVTTCSRQEPADTARFLAFGTLIDLTIVGVEPEAFDRISAAIENDFAYMHHAWHAWDPGPLGRVNQLLPSGEPFVVPPSVLPLLERGIQLARASDDLFNPAIGKLIGLWGFHSEEMDPGSLPSAEEIERLVMANPRMSDLTLKGITLRCTNPAVQIDFGGMGKGYGIDLAIQHLRELGVANAIVNAGGDLRAIGSRDGRPWRIAIRNPSGGGVIATLETRGDESVFTSGNYERYFTKNGKRYHHIIDPRTGYPAEGVKSVTVVHTEATVADAAATALFVAGPEHWHRIAEQLGIRFVLLVDEHGVLHMNPAMAQRLHLLDPSREIRLSPPLAGAAGAQLNAPTALRNGAAPPPVSHAAQEP